MKTQSEWFCEQTERMRQVAKERARGPEFFRPYWETKKGHWELIYPDFDDIRGYKCNLIVKCLDCGQTFMRPAGLWLVACNENGCSNCAKMKLAMPNVKLIQSKGFDVDASKTDKKRGRIYKIKCPKCGETFVRMSRNLHPWLRRGAICPVCMGKSFPPNIMKIRKLSHRFGFTYLELSERANYDYKFVMNIVSGHRQPKETIKLLADVAEEMAKEKEHGNSRIGQFN